MLYEVITHTAVKIAPHYHRDAVVYVPDASRSVAVATQLVGDGKRALLAPCIDALGEEQQRCA